MVSRLQRVPGMRLMAPAGAFYLFPDVSACIGAPWTNGPLKNDNDVASWLLEEAMVAVVPGSAFGAPNHLRLSFACSMADLTEAADRIERALGKLLKR